MWRVRRHQRESETLLDQEWPCGCGAVHDRDLNAARNVKREERSQIVVAGHAVTFNTRERVSDLRKQAVLDEARIRRPEP